MSRGRIDSLETRVRELRATTERLQEEQATVQKRIRALEATVDGSSSPNSYSTSTDTHVDTASSVSENPGASDEEVAAAVRAIEDDLDEERNEDDEDIIVV